MSHHADSGTRIGGLPRGDALIQPVAFEDLPEPLKTALAPRVARLGYLGGFFALLAHQPAALGAFNDYTEELKTALDPSLTEVVALSIATALDNQYERVQHERLSAVQGRSADWVAEASHGGSQDALSATERAVRELALGMLADGGRVTSSKLTAVQGDLGDAGTAAVLMLIGRYIAHAHISNALGLTSPVKAEHAES